MISVLVAASLVAAARGAEPDVFERLASTYGVHSRVKLYTPPGGERGLYATSRVKAGEPVLAVPFELCLVCVAEAGDESITSPWDAPHRDAKDTMLARKLLYALGKGAAIPDDAAVTPVQQAFWQEWQEMLPPMGSLSHPVTLLEAALEDLHDGRLAKAALLQQGRVDAVLADVAQASTDERRWAVALSSSRPFTIPLAHDDERRAQALAAFVPFVDMANHDADANCVVEGRGSGGGVGGGVSGGAVPAFDVVGLVASRDLDAGEEILISYFDAEPNSHIFSRFGFVVAEGNRHDRLGLPEGLPPLSSEAVRVTTKANAGRWDSAGPLFEAALLSMPLTREPSQGAAAEREAAASIAQVLRDTAAQDFATSLEEDEANSGASTSTMALQYRMLRKRLFKVALDVLAAHQEAHAD